MKGQPERKVIPFTSPDEQEDEFLLQDVFARADVLEDGYGRMAEQLYRLRMLWIGGMGLPWGLLTDGQRAGYINEIRALVTKAKGEK